MRMFKRSRDQKALGELNSIPNSLPSHANIDEQTVNCRNIKKMQAFKQEALKFKKKSSNNTVPTRKQ